MSRLIPIVHVAGPVDDLVQRCARCGQVLTDYRNTMGVGNWSPSWWAEGQISVYEGNPSHFVAGREPDGVDCLPQERPS
jgi:hypothetical protein